MTEQERTWLDAASRYGGSFVQTFANACYCADGSNFALLRPVLAQIMAKYPAYSEGAYGFGARRVTGGEKGARDA